MDKIYKTAEVAKRVGVHPNTVRLYEKLELIPKVNRLSNGYRVFTDYHIEQFNLARTAFKVEVLQNGLRKKIINVVKLSAKGEFQEAINCINDYINQIKQERKNAEEAIELSKKLLLEIDAKDNYIFFTRKQNGYRVYTESDINRLKIIRTLRCANYSLSAILRMLNAISESKEIDIREVINKTKEDEDIVTACDKLLTSLSDAEKNANSILKQLEFMKNEFNTNSTL
ncbi:MerR family transcriptional regulator [Clostridium botulinum]|uniref:MerR family transcriptional regulator n=1 Tax=Clostridium botulinum TaxID=1491 RepID=UPI0007736532|nr:MerR family transcriptional regulator [Clostridium botulinum]AUN02341.1 MerR family transcriptional regulator [Clostridium botulinum]